MSRTRAKARDYMLACTLPQACSRDWSLDICSPRSLARVRLALVSSRSGDLTLGFQSMKVDSVQPVLEYFRKVEGHHDVAVSSRDHDFLMRSINPHSIYEIG